MSSSSEQSVLLRAVPLAVLLAVICVVPKAAGASFQLSLESQIVDSASGFVLDGSAEMADGSWGKTFLRNGKTLQIRATPFGDGEEAMFATAGLAAGIGSELDTPTLIEHPDEVGVFIVEGRLEGNRTLSAFYVEGSAGFLLVYQGFAPDDTQVFTEVLDAQLAHSAGERVQFSGDLLARVREDIGAEVEVQEFAAPTSEAAATATVEGEGSAEVPESNSPEPASDAEVGLVDSGSIAASIPTAAAESEHAEGFRLGQLVGALGVIGVMVGAAVFFVRRGL